MGNGKKMMIYPWLTVYQTARLGMVSCVEATLEENIGLRENNEIILTDEKPNAACLLMKKDLAEHLSKEAKEIVNLVLDSPQEIVDSFKTEKYRKVSKEKIKDNLLAKGWDKKLIVNVFNELRMFTTELAEIGE